MKKIICFFIFILFLGCDQSANMFLGVGQALDSESPKISITSPENGIYVNKSDITITGNCSDNVGVTRIRAEAGINETASIVTEEIKFPSMRDRSWSVTFDKNDLDRILNLWRSGLKVTFTFTCYDAAGNTTVEHLFLYVDVEKPTVIINRPEVRFTEAEKVKYENDVESFKKDYDINKFEKVNSFVNKEFILKGYVDDDYSVKSTYINIYNSTKKKQVGVTPVIFKDGTYIAGGNGVHGGVTGNSQSWEFKLDSTQFCSTEGWYVLEVVTEDDAGNEKRQFVDKDWIYINQAADIPRNNFTSFSPGFKLNAGNMIAGNGFDDDGMKEIWIKIVPESKADPDTPYTDWQECNEANYIVKKCADFTAGGQLGNWSLNVPSKAGNYIIYAVPVDIYDVAPQAPYEGIYTSYFSVASEEDPVVGIDGQFRGATIVDEKDITGFFYDNEKVTKITAKMKFDEQEEGEPIVLYDSSKQENLITIDKRENFSLMTGQIVVKHFFTWNFKASNYPAFKILQMSLRAEDEDDYYGEDAVTIYGDSERPSFIGEISPANNSDVIADNVFKGTVSDNVGVVKVIIENENNENGWECRVSTPVKTTDGKYESTFESNEISPKEFGGYIDSEFTVTAIDAAGNKANHIIFLKGDKNKAQIEFYDENGEKQKSGSYATKDKTFNIRITPPSFTDGTYKEMSQVFYSLDGKIYNELDLGRYSGEFYSVPLKVETLVSGLGENYSGDVTLQIKAIDKTGNESPGTLYFIVDNEAPNGLSITSPMLRDKDFITKLADEAKDIDENDISYYQNKEMTLKATISDNYKINEAVLDFYNAEGKSKIHSVTLTYDEEGKLSVSDEKGIVTASSGIPGNFTLKIDTTKFADGDYLLKTTAYDAAGNSAIWGNEEDVKSKDYYFKVLQEADIPRIIYNVDFDSDGKVEIFPGTTLKGAVVDDDAVAEKGVRYLLLKEEELVEYEEVKTRFENSDESLSKFDNIKSFTRQDWQIEFVGIGTYYLYMQVKDKYEEYSQIYERKIIVSSSEKPHIESIKVTKGTGVTEDENNGYYNGNINIVVAANGGEEALKDIMFRITSSGYKAKDTPPIEQRVSTNNFDFGTPADDDLGKWYKFIFTTQKESCETITLSFDSKLFTLETETITVEVQCTNITNSSSVVVKDKIAIDNEGPTLKIASPVANASVNKKFDIQGSANDRGAGVDKVYVNCQAEPKEPASYEELMSDKWIELTLKGISWEGRFDSEKIPDGSYPFMIAASDKLGNFSVLQQSIIIDQDGDRPIVRLQNLNLSTGGTILHKSGFIYGTISDDDGEVRSVQISENGVLEADDEKWGKNLYSNGSWEYTFNGDGEKKLAFKVVDSEKTTFISAITSGLDVPKIIDSTGNKKTDSIFTITVDTESPEMTDVYFNAEPNTEPDFPTSKDVDTSVWSNSFSGKTFGGTEKKMWFLIGGTDENGIASCTLTATDQNSGVDIPDPDRIETAHGTSFYKYEIGISKVTLTSLNFKIVMEDNSGLTTQKSFTVNIDNTAPTVSITSHSDGNSVYGTESNTIKGIVGEKDSTVEYALTTDSASPDAGDYIEIGNSSNWEIVFKDNDILNNKIKNLYNVTGKFEDSYDLYVWLKATDKYGNVSKPTMIRLVVLPNGDKPKVSIDYPKNPTAGEKPNVLGGRITISGDTEIATNNVKEVYIQIYPSNADNCDFADFAENWESKLETNAKDEGLKDKVVSDSTVSAVKGIPVTSSSKTSWRLNINENKTMSSGLVAIKAIAVSDTGKYTESEIVVFEIDKEVPQFTDLKLVQYKDGVAVKTLGYEDEMWVSGDGWYLECMIEDDSGIDTIQKGDKVIGVGNLESLDNEKKRYKVKVPLAIIKDQYGQDSFTLYGTDIDKKQGEKNFIINFDNKVPDFCLDEDWNDYEIKDKKNDKKRDIENSPDSGLYTISGEFKEEGNQSGFERIAMYFTRKVGEKTYIIDPMLDKGDDGKSNRCLTSSDDIMHWIKVGATINNGEITLSDSDSDSVPANVRIGGLVKVSGAIYRINDISGKQIVVSGNPDTTANEVELAIAQVIDNLTIESYDKKSDFITYDDGDKMVEGVYRTTGTYDWTVSINTANIFDGDVDVHFVAFDKAGNVTKKTYQGKVKNNNPRIAGVLFGTDKNGDGKIEEGKREWVTSFENIYDAGKTVAEGKLEEQIGVNGKDANSKKITNLKLPLEGDKALMTIKDSIKVNAKVVGGNTNLQWQWKIEDKKGDFDWSGLKKFKDEGVVGSSYGDVIRTNLPMMEITMLDFLKAKKNGEVKGVGNLTDTTLSIRIWDETEGTTVGVDSQCAEINVVVNTILQDNQAPTVTITPFYWKSESNNSLYQNNRANGHIELEDDLPTDIFKADTGIYDRDPKVSGKITIEGTATDNVQLKELLATIKGFNGDKEFTMATYENGSWKSDGNMNKDGWACEVETDETEENDHKVNWKFHWDTEKLSPVAATDVTVSVSAKDRGKASVSVSGNKVVYETENTSESVSCQMDVVPYITGIYRAKTVNTNRARSGAVPVLRKEANNYIEGFNLGSGITATITTAADGSGDSYNLSPAYSDGVATYTVPNKVKDGYLNVKVNGVSSLNNINDDSKEYNKEVNPYLEETTYWTDNRSVRVWKNESTDYFPGSGSPVYPAMSMGSDGTLYASFSNYSDASVYYSQMGGSATKVFYTFDPSEETDIHVSGTGTVNVAYSANYHGGYESSWSNAAGSAGGLYVYDVKATDKNPGRDIKYKFNKFELFYHDKMLQQFKNIRVKRSDTADDGLVHVAYYDKVTSSIHYSNSPGNGNQGAEDNEYAWVNIDGGYDEDDTGSYFKNLTSSGGRWPTYTVEYQNSIRLADSNFEGTKRSSGTGESVGLALTKSGYPVVVYYDTDNMILKVARATQENPKGNTSYWEVQDVLATGDINYKSMVDYISCDIDTNGNLHIAFQNGKNQLCYVKSTNASANGSATYTFGKSVVIASGATWIDLTLKETTPYISYLSKINSKDGMNIAFYDSTFDTDFNGTANGEWETMVAPLNYKVSNVRSCIEVHPTPESSEWEAAVGFTPGDNYRVAYYVGSGKGH